ncbi:hypothetical protein R3P38DRAFT_3288503 [Favolaschia claudopus]|uniref:SAM domain-containing protein n=1 Tax=Favolaschia claudopus TaxID=2862362 RepID=A0AAV9ZWH8_9AGAR
MGPCNVRWRSDSGKTGFPREGHFSPSEAPSCPFTRRALLPERIYPQGAGSVSDIGHLASMITTIFGAAGGVKPVQPSTPQKSLSTQSLVPNVVNSPPVPTPSKLSRYLEHAETKLGVSNARMFETDLRENGYGPDILHLVDNKDLEGLGISKGNVIRLKAGAPKSESAGNSGTGIGQDVTVTPSKRVAYEVRYKDGGSSRLFGPRLSPGPRLEFPDGEVFYKNLERNIFEPIPLGYRPIFDLQPGERHPFARSDDEDVFGGGGGDDHPPPLTIPPHP